jgi:hypothetical protein
MRTRRIVLGAAAALALAAGGVGVAQAVGGDDSDERVSGPDAERAGRAAVAAVGGGRAIEVERADEGDSGWEVEVRTAGGSVTEVNLDDGFRAVRQEPGDDGPGDRDDDD